MLQFQPLLFGAFFFTNDVMCCGYYDIIYHPFPINSQYMKTWRDDSPGNGFWQIPLITVGSVAVHAPKMWKVKKSDY